MGTPIKRYLSVLKLFLGVVIAIFLSNNASANIVINGTRVIYNAEESEATIRLSNVSSTPSLVQVWLDSGDMKSTPETGKSPFIATPPIFRVEANKAQTVRIVYTHDPLPQDKESVFWVNILDVPPMPAGKDAQDANYMQLAIRSRIKLFYRPKDLPGSAVDAANQLRWEFVENGDNVSLHVSNDSAFSVSLDAATVVIGDKSYAVATEMLMPASSKNFLVRELHKNPSQTVQLNYSNVNDFGSVVPHNINLPR